MIKKILYNFFAVTILAFSAVSCSNEDAPELVQDVKSQTTLSEDALEAIAVADEFLGRPQSRAGETPQVLPILNDVLCC